VQTNSETNEDGSELVVTWIIDDPKNQSIRQIIESRIMDTDCDVNDEDFML
jgi:hypothetical protein